MKILHCCLASFYIDDFGYQENVLPKIHELQGHTVEILASTETYLKDNRLGYLTPSEYYNSDGIKVTRIPYLNYLPLFIVKKLRIYVGIKRKLEEFKPDIIFLHDIQFLSIRQIALCKRNNPEVVIFADSHTDFVNSARGLVSKNILHGIVYKFCAKLIEPYTAKFYGTLPARVDFLKSMYKISSDKVELLELGADDTLFDFSHYEAIRSSTRERLNLSKDDFVIICGGKIDKRKNIHLLVDAIEKLEGTVIKLILFGTPDSEMGYLLEKINTVSNIKYLGWQSTADIYNLLFAADLGVFPGTHSVLWEQACGVGLPCVFKKWDMIQHVDLGGNCVFIQGDDSIEIQDVITKISTDKILYQKMKEVAIQKCVPHFSYSKIAKRAINIYD